MDFSRATCIYRPGGVPEAVTRHTVDLSLCACMLPACLPACLLLEYVLLAQARPTMSCIALVYRTSCPMRMREDYVESIFKFKGQSRPSQQDREESRTGETREVSLHF